MSYFAPSTSSLQSMERIGQSAIRSEQRYASFFCYAQWLMSPHGLRNSLCNTSIHILDDDSLLHVFYLYRPSLLGEDQDDTRLFGREQGWACRHRPPSYVAQRFLVDAALGRDASLRIFAVMNDQFQLRNSILFNKSPPFPFIFVTRFFFLLALLLLIDE